MSVSWNPWHGCIRLSEGCQNCYVYRIDGRYEKESSEVTLNKSFYLPVEKKRSGEYRVPSFETVYTCFSSDFFIDAADEWRVDAWSFIRERDDLRFVIITKRIDRFYASLPDDWGNGYDNVTIGCTCENQKRADYRLPIFLSLPIKHKFIVCEPLLEAIDLSAYLTKDIDSVIVGGESGENARVCDIDWVLGIRESCIAAGEPFKFKQTGANFKKDGKIYCIPRKHQFSQAERSGLSCGTDIKLI